MLYTHSGWSKSLYKCSCFCISPKFCCFWNCFCLSNFRKKLRLKFKVRFEKFLPVAFFENGRKRCPALKGWIMNKVKHFTVIFFFYPFRNWWVFFVWIKNCLLKLFNYSFVFYWKFSDKKILFMADDFNRNFCSLKADVYHSRIRLFYSE